MSENRVVPFPEATQKDALARLLVRAQETGDPKLAEALYRQTLAKIELCEMQTTATLDSFDLSPDQIKICRSALDALDSLRQLATSLYSQAQVGAN